jgi:hypothetical protein
MLVCKKNKSTIHLHVIPVMKCGFVFLEFTYRSWQHEKRRLCNLPKPTVEMLHSTFSLVLDLHGGGRPEMSENTVHYVANRLLASPRKSLCVLS